MKKEKIHFLPEYITSGLHPVTINVIGCGGTGSHLLAQLARIHISLVGLNKPGLSVACYDPDIVTESNLGRQLFAPSDIGINKAQVLINRINRTFGLDWISYPYHFNKSVYKHTNHLSSNIIISCVDSASSRLQIHDVIQELFSKNEDSPKRSYYWLDLGNTKDTAQCIIGTTSSFKQPKSRVYHTVKNLPTLMDRYPYLTVFEKEQYQGPSCSVAESLSKQELFINSILAQYSANILWNMLKDGYTTICGAFINMKTYSISPLTLQNNIRPKKPNQ